MIAENESQNIECKNVNVPEATEAPEVRLTPDAFRARIKKAALADFLGLMGALDDEARVTVTAEGMRSLTVDPDHVAMVDASLSTAAFEEWHLEGEGDLGLDLDKLKKVLQFAKKKTDTIDLSMDGEGKILTVSINGMDRDMPLKNTKYMADPRMPSYPERMFGFWAMESEDLMATLKQVKEVADYLGITLTAEGLVIEAEGDKDKVKRALSKDMLFSMETKERARSYFPLDYMTDIVKALGAFDIIEAHMGNDMPIALDGSSPTMRAHFMLAPRIESD
jgi:proliferating cell nuclear antigen